MSVVIHDIIGQEVIFRGKGRIKFFLFGPWFLNKSKHFSSKTKIGQFPIENE